MEHTKGEWKESRTLMEGRLIYAENEDYEIICSNVRHWNKDIIMAAPDLYRACKRAEQMLQYPQALSNEAKNYELEDLRKALAKAEGK